MEISKAFSKWVYEDGMEAVEDSSHPCRPMVDWQTENGFTPFQLPEPFTGSKSDLGLAFIGLNPSIFHSRSIPKATPEWSFEKYNNFYRNRIDNGLRRPDGKLAENVRLWNAIERFGDKYLSDLIDNGFQLGVNATLIEAVRYKSTRRWLGNKDQEAAILKHQHQFTERLLEETDCNIVVPMGNDAVRQLNTLLTFSKPIPSKIGAAMGNMYIGDTTHGKKLFVCPIQHMSYPPGSKKERMVADRILEAFRELSNISTLKSAAWDDSRKNVALLPAE